MSVPLKLTYRSVVIHSPESKSFVITMRHGSRAFKTFNGVKKYIDKIKKEEAGIPCSNMREFDRLVPQD